jgi:hypothetical protein
MLHLLVVGDERDGVVDRRATRRVETLIIVREVEDERELALGDLVGAHERAAPREHAYATL